MRRIVVTGMGVVTPVGIGVREFSTALREGRQGSGPVTRFELNGLGPRNAFEVKNFTPPEGTEAEDPFLQYALAAAAETLEMARFDPAQADPYRVGIVVSSSKGGMHSLTGDRGQVTGTSGTSNLSPVLDQTAFPNLMPGSACQWIGRRWNLRGPSKCYVTACVTGTTSVIEAASMIEEGTVDYAVAGASDASITPLLMAGYDQMRVLAREAMLPFDERRKGFLLGEGAGILFLETLESARARGAKIYGEIIGHATGADVYHPVAFDPEGDSLARTLETLLKKSGLAPEEVDYLNLHGTATREGDLYETRQVKRAFGKRAYEIPTSSTKSMTGHMLGASGAVEIIASLLALERGFIPPTAGLERSDPACDLDYTPVRAREKKITTAISHSLGFGGHLAAIALRKI